MLMIGTLIVGILLAVAFIGAGGAKLAGAAPMRQAAAHLGYSFGSFRFIGALELIGAVGVLAGLWAAGPLGPRLGVAAAIGLAVLMVGATITHRRAGDPAAQWAPSLVLALVAGLYIALRLFTV